MSEAHVHGAEVNLDFERLQERVGALDPARASADPVLRSIAEHSPDMIMLLDRQGVIRFINHTAPDLTVDKVLGSSVQVYVPPEHRQHTWEHYERVASTAKPTHFDSVYVAENGECTYWSSRVGPLLVNGQVAGFVVVTRDVTEARSREHFFALSEDMLCVIGPDGCFERVSPAFEETLGYGARDLIGVRALDLVHPDDRARSAAMQHRVRAGETALDFENRFRRRDGEYRFITWRASADSDGMRLYSIGRDVTQLKHLQAQLQQADRLDAIGRLASGIAHDFGNLLLAIRLNLRSARERVRDAELAGQLSVIEAATERAAGLTRQLLGFARPQLAAAEAFDVNHLCRDLYALLRRVIPENIEIVLNLRPQGCVVDADRVQLEQVLMNLCLNARDAMPHGGTLCIASDELRADREFCAEHPRARLGRSYAVLRVEDTGTGMSPDVQARLFEPFFSTKPYGRGTGLGLATAQAGVSRFGGLFRVRSRLGKGSCFEVYLPRSPAAPVAPAPRPAAMRERGHETVLVAEDEELVRGALARLLEQAGYTVLLAEDGLEAVTLFRRFRRDIRLLILDITMPRMNGPQALAEIRQLAPDARAIFTSGYEGVEAEQDDPAVLQKPFEPAALLERVRRELDAVASDVPTVDA